MNNHLVLYTTVGRLATKLLSQTKISPIGTFLDCAKFFTKVETSMYPIRLDSLRGHPATASEVS